MRLIDGKYVITLNDVAHAWTNMPEVRGDRYVYSPRIPMDDILRDPGNSAPRGPETIPRIEFIAQYVWVKDVRHRDWYYGDLYLGRTIDG